MLFFLQTIFEINSTARCHAKDVMKLKRGVHSKIVSATREKQKDVKTNRDEGVVTKTDNLATEEDLVGFKNPKNLKNTKGNNAQCIVISDYYNYTWLNILLISFNRRPAIHQVYAIGPSLRKRVMRIVVLIVCFFLNDNFLFFFSLSVQPGVSFDQEAAGAVLDIMGDENQHLKRPTNTMKW